MIWEMVPLYPVLGSDQGLVNLKKSLKSFPIELHRISHFEKGALFAKVIAFYSQNMDMEHNVHTPKF